MGAFAIVVDELAERTLDTILKTILYSCIKYFGAMGVLVFDQEGAVTSDMVARTCDRYFIKL